MQIWICKSELAFAWHYLFFKFIIFQVPILTMGISWSSNVLITNIVFFIKNRWKLNISVSTPLSFFPAYTLLKGAVGIALTRQLRTGRWTLLSSPSHLSVGFEQFSCWCQSLSERFYSDICLSVTLVSTFQGNFSPPWMSVCLTTVQSQLSTMHHGSISSRKQGKRKIY